MRRTPGSVSRMLATVVLLSATVVGTAITGAAAEPTQAPAVATPEADAGQLGLGTVLTDEPGLTSRVEGSTPVTEGAASTSTAG